MNGGGIRSSPLQQPSTHRTHRTHRTTARTTGEPQPRSFHTAHFSASELLNMKTPLAATPIGPITGEALVLLLAPLTPKYSLEVESTGVRLQSREAGSGATSQGHEKGAVPFIPQRRRAAAGRRALGQARAAASRAPP